MADGALRVEGLTLAAGGRTLVNGLSFDIGRGEVLGLVGESGSGKSLTAAAIADLLPGGVSRPGGSIRLDGRELTALDPLQRRAMAGGAIGMVFQDPMSAFNPVKHIGDLHVRSLMLHAGLERAAARARAVAAFAAMNLPDPERLIDVYPHQLSGGQRQRAMIALALINDPALLIADEPTTALDATVQRQILALLKRRSAGRALLMITHDLGVAASICDRLAVLYRGHLVELGPTAQVLAAPRHPYTRMLIDARLALSGEGTFKLRHGAGAMATDPGDGCPYRPRCAQADDRCAALPPMAGGALCWHPLAEAAA
ncbi:MAG: ABC transporter ATP-binding protein [Alphaproteobacteria bacterium]|nr:ABC transporter ATP-binding protein [Alphaproteobacteria bacterium]